MRVAATSGLAQEFRLVLPAKLKNKNSASSVYSCLCGTYVMVYLFRKKENALIICSCDMDNMAPQMTTLILLPEFKVTVNIIQLSFARFTNMRKYVS